MSNTPAGWHDDGSGRQRWWDGTAWTDAYQDEQAQVEPVVPSAPQRPVVTANGLGIASLVTGGVAFLIGWLPFIGALVALAAIILGVLALRKNQRKWMSVVGVSLGGIALVTSIAVTIGVGLIPADELATAQQSRQAEQWAEKLGAEEAEAKKEAEKRQAEEAKAAEKKAEEAKAEKEAAEKAEKEEAAAAAEKKAEDERAAKEKAEKEASMVLVPDVSKLDGAQAEELIESVGLKAEFDGGSKSVFAPGNWQVMSTSPAIGKKVDLGSKVIVKVEKKKYTPPPVETTSGGVDAIDAWLACTYYAETQFPYGVKVHSLAGRLAERLENDEWFLKAEITPKNEYGTKVSGMVMECTVAGTQASPQVTSFLAY
ncbi:PASTA domain-containing protein [Leucobacter manosquensis]|uniref:PASTA domain-containing protein n=1 Tax=Leucobacter manosquensis TaxID=2810611 RepID=A0ABS5M9Y1_9MICO|nr:PASTA domain-containing protein [Leucobacter manosquensis]MBS3183466.1 PASTA domain-containing protein [Leucobacter manosquensis]